MAALRGGIQSDRRDGSTGTRLGSEVISSWVNTWGERAEVFLHKDGSGTFRLKDERTGEEIQCITWGPNGGRGA